MALRAYLIGVGLEAGLALACALPFALVGLWRARERRGAWGALAAVGALVVAQCALGDLPRLGALQHLHWSWQAALLTAALALAGAALVPGASLASIGVTARFERGWLRPSLVALLIAFAAPAVVFALGSRVTLTAEGWIYLALMPGLAEELLFRGLFQSLLNRALGTPWRVAGAASGWGLVVTAVLFAGANGLVRVDGAHARLAIPAAIAPLIAGLVSGWVRDRTNSVWPSVVGHNLSNLVIPIATLAARLG